MQIKGAIFDMDGILFDTEKIYQQTWQELADMRNIKLESGFMKAVSGTSGTHMRQVIEKYYRVPDGTELVNECIESVKNKLSVYVPMKKGVKEILRFFKEKKIHIAVASSSPFRQIESNLKNADIREYFDEVVSGTEVEQGKPAPDIFLYAAEKIGCQPEECFVFEDSENGIRAGYRAGCATIMIPDMVQPTPEIKSYCYKICSDLEEAQREIEKSLYEKKNFNTF